MLDMRAAENEPRGSRGRRDDPRRTPRRSVARGRQVEAADLRRRANAQSVQRLPRAAALVPDQRWVHAAMMRKGGTQIPLEGAAGRVADALGIRMHPGY